MVTLLGFLEHHEIIVEHLLLGERDTIEALHLLAISVTTPESTSNACKLDSLDFARIYKVRTTTEVREIALRISSDRTIFQILLNVLAFVGLAIGSKLLKSIGLGNLLANNGLFLGSQFLHLSFNRGEIALLYALAVGQQHIVEEAILDSRSETKLDARVQFLQSLS